MKSIFVTGTDTDVGKTIVSAGLCLSWPAHYWKPIQAGADPCTDNEIMAQFIPKGNIYPSTYNLKKACSPNQAAQWEDITIQKDSLMSAYKKIHSPVVIEGAGGALVPFNDQESMLDLMVQFNAPVIIVARSALGTLNHSFLTLKALRTSNINILGIIMVGKLHPDNKRDIEAIGNIPVLLELPMLKKIDIDSLKEHFKKLKSFLSAL